MPVSPAMQAALDNLATSVNNLTARIAASQDDSAQVAAINAEVAKIDAIDPTAPIAPPPAG